MAVHPRSRAVILRRLGLLLLPFMASIGAAGQADVDPGLRDRALEAMSFSEPVELLLNNNPESGWQISEVAGGFALQKLPNAEKLLRDFLIPAGYCRELGRDRFEPTTTLRQLAHKVNAMVNIGGLEGVTVARREFGEYTFVNRFKAQHDPFGEVQKLAFKFTYHFVPVLAGFPGVGPFEGKVVCFIDPMEGTWVIETAELHDEGINEFAKWIQELPETGGATTEQAPSPTSGPSPVPLPPFPNVSGAWGGTIH